MCRALSAALVLPYYPIDKIQWRPGWVPAPEPEFNAEHDVLLETASWIIDGFGPWESVERRFDAADTIIFVDHPLWIHYWWATKRQLKSIIRDRPDGPEGCPMLPVTFRLYRMMWLLHREARPRLLDALEAHRDSKTVIHIRSPREMAEFSNAHGCRRSN